MGRQIVITCFFSLIVLLCVSKTNAHGTVVIPYNWFDHKMWVNSSRGYVYDYVGMKSGLMCHAGCELNGKDLCPNLEHGCEIPAPGCSCMWFKNYTFIQKPVLFNKKYRTYNYVKNQRAVLHTPWRAPGRAHVDSPCGTAGGNMHGCVGGNCNRDQLGYRYGIDALHFKFPHKIYVTTWRRGEIVEAVWGITANHGGGYSYRLCKVPKGGVSELTEEICQKIPLKFFGKTQWAQYGEDRSTRVSFPAVRITEGTYPPGSEWTKNPIPPCKGLAGGATNPSKKCFQGFQFPPPKPGLAGFGLNDVSSYVFKFSVIDKLIIPKNIDPGMYVLSFRWDCEQTPQVWNSCSSILIK